MSLLFLFVMHSFFEHMPFTIICLVIAGVVLYLVGVVFFVWEKIRHHHAIWHFMVLLASICHFIAVIQTVS
jgi:hemolysin III